MSKGRRTNKGTKEYSDLQRIKHELDQLEKEYNRLSHELDKSSRENARLRKQLSRADGFLLDMSEISMRNQTKSEVRAYQKAQKDAKKSKWICHDCGEGHLLIHKLKLLDGIVRYYRLCSKEGCGNRTKMQLWNEKVEGIEAVEKSEEES